MRVLYIEDNPSNIRVMRRVAEHAACDLDTALSAEAGLRALGQGYDLLLLDIGLPDADGFVLARQIRAVYPTLPIIAVTADAMEGDRAACLAAGCTEYVRKPYPFFEMVALLRRYAAQCP